jgi:hypothetical protein
MNFIKTNELDLKINYIIVLYKYRAIYFKLKKANRIIK